MEDSLKKNVWNTLQYSRNLHNVVHQLYFNEKKFTSKNGRGQSQIECSIVYTAVGILRKKKSKETKAIFRKQRRIFDWGS